MAWPLVLFDDYLFWLMWGKVQHVRTRARVYRLCCQLQSVSCYDMADCKKKMSAIVVTGIIQLRYCVWFLGPCDVCSMHALGARDGWTGCVCMHRACILDYYLRISGK